MPKNRVRKGYRFSKGRYRSPVDLTIGEVDLSTPPEAEEIIGLIHGQMARSPEEWRVSVALDKLHRDYVYQYPIGPPGIRGSFYVDFLVENAPNWFPLEVQSERYHTGLFAKDEKLRQTKIERVVNAQMRFVWEDELQNQDDAFQAVKRVLYDPVIRR